MSTKPILFCDFDGVLCHDRFWRSLSHEECDMIQTFLFKNNSNLVSDWMRGGYSSEEINQMVSQNTGISFERLWQVFIQDCKTMSVEKRVLEIITSLRKDYIVILITGNMDCFDRFTLPILELHRYFDYISNSFNERILKTDNNGELYSRLSSRFAVPLEHCLAFDDSESTLRTFSELGGSSHLVTKDNDIMFHLTNLSTERSFE